MMVLHDCSADAPYDKPWVTHFFCGVFGPRRDPPSLSSWVVPGTWPEWCL